MTEDLPETISLYKHCTRITTPSIVPLDQTICTGVNKGPTADIGENKNRVLMNRNNSPSVKRRQ